MDNPKIKRIKNGKISVESQISLKGVTASKVYWLILKMDEELYKTIHPQAHLAFELLPKPTGAKGPLGCVFYFKECLENGRVIEGKLKLIEAEKNKRLVLKSIWPWWKPFTLIIELQRVSKGISVIHEVIAGFDLPILGLIFNFLAKPFFLSETDIQAIHKHAQEEFQGLREEIIERKSSRSVIHNFWA